MTEARPTVHVVDDDESLRAALTRLLKAAGYGVCAHASAGDFLLHKHTDTPGCVLLDVRMPGPSGLDLFESIAARDDSPPVVFLTAHADVAMSVRAMKNGAVDFLEKPVERDALLAAVEAAVERDRERRAARAVRDRIRQLTPREQQVLAAIRAGKLNKQIAGDLGISERTVKTQRASVMQKLGVRTVAQLVQVVDSAGPAGPA